MKKKNKVFVHRLPMEACISIKRHGVVINKKKKDQKNWCRSKKGESAS